MHTSALMFLVFMHLVFIVQSAQIPVPHGETDGFSFQDAIRIEQEAHAHDKQKHEEMLEKRRRMGLPIKGERETTEMVAARIHAFMWGGFDLHRIYPTNDTLLRASRNYKGSDSEGDDDDWDEDEDDENPAAWFEDDQDDGRKGQDIVEPDYQDLSHIIRIDDTRIAHNIFYEPRDKDW